MSLPVEQSKVDALRFEPVCHVIQVDPALSQ